MGALARRGCLVAVACLGLTRWPNGAGVWIALMLALLTLSALVLRVALPDRARL
jgi:hypothetical protein